MRVAELFEKRGNLKSATEYYKKVVQKDPTSELAYQRLMLNYSNRGMRNAALKAYEDCTRVLRNELDVEPDALTTSTLRNYCLLFTFHSSLFTIHYSLFTDHYFPR